MSGEERHGLWHGKSALCLLPAFTGYLANAWHSPAILQKAAECHESKHGLPQSLLGSNPRPPRSSCVTLGTYLSVCQLPICKMGVIAIAPLSQDCTEE